jgi:hypothetical protein
VPPSVTYLPPGRSALDGLKGLADAGALRQITQGGYDRQFAADELFDLIERYEERIAAT